MPRGNEKFSIGDKVVLNGNPQDEQEGDNMNEGFVYTITDVMVSTHKPNTSGQWVKVDSSNWNDWIDCSWFDSAKR
jgi:hypothetical protein